MNRSILVVFVALGLSVLIGLPAQAQRRSVSRLQAQINQLEAENNSQQAEIDALQLGALRVFDANGRDIGIYAHGIRADLILLLVEDPEVLVRLRLGSGEGNIFQANLYFEEAGCGGTAFVDFLAIGGGNTLSPIRTVFTVGSPQRYFIANAEPQQAITSLSVGVPGDCTDQGPEDKTVVSATEVTLAELGLSFPLPAPLYIGTPQPAP